MTSLQNSKKILVTTSPDLTIDKYIAIHTIATSLKSDLNKEVHIGISKNPSDKFTNILPMKGIKIINKLSPKKYLLEFRGQKNKVKNIQWNQENDKLNFYLTMGQGEFNSSDHSIKITGSDYQMVIMVGVNNLSELGAIFQEGKEVMKSAEIISVGGKIKDEPLKIGEEIDEKHSSISEDTYFFMQKFNLKINANRATNLLAGIFSATDNFNKNLRDPKTFITCAELIRKGGSNEIASKLFDNNQNQNISTEQTKQHTIAPQTNEKKN